MSVACEPKQRQTAAPVNLNQGTILETLNLHSTAINTALERLLALEAKLGTSPVKLPASSPVPPCPPGGGSIPGGSIGDGTPEAAALWEEVSKIKWNHRIDLGHGIITPGGNRSQEKLATLHVPESLEGMTFLDIGAWDGFYSFEAERRGAKRVLATDWDVWLNRGWGSKAGFDFAKRVLKSKVEETELDVMEASPEKIGMFDVVLFAGVLYHLRHPLLALERVFSVTKKLLVLETHVDLTQVKRPVMAFYPNDEAGGDSTNWWGPNTSCVLEMLKSVGFRNVHVVSASVSGDVPSIEEITYGRIAVHAER